LLAKNFMADQRTVLAAELFKRAVDRPVEQRSAFLTEACGDDVELRREVESLLKFNEGGDQFLEKPAMDIAVESLFQTALKPDQRIGNYRVDSHIGSGGMGEVYLAHDEKLNRQVALKLVRFGIGADETERHFRREAQILASLNHPNIAHLYGAEITPEGFSFLVMEYIEGVRIDKYCDNNHLSINDRLEMFRRVCGAIHYAHQRLIIHRDIKPANILITKEGEPKLLDFGIAKLLDPETSMAGEQTLTIAAAMTPEYASPEQVRGETMTTASDVYSLGVILYELLTGQRPYRIKGRNAAEIARAITDQEPTRPSTAVARGDGNLKSLKGDLDNIVLKAMRKEPQRRYASVEQFSEDIRRHLANLPVIARPDTTSYRMAKFVQRHKTGVAAAALIALSLVAGVVATFWQAGLAREHARVATGERNHAREETAKAERINQFLQDILSAAAPEAKGVDVKVTDVLGEASKRARTELASEPEVMADALLTLGRTYVSLGQYFSADADLRAALDASLRANGELNETTAASMAWLGLNLFYESKIEEGERTSHRAVQLERKLHPEGNQELAVALYSLGLHLTAQNNVNDAELVLKEASEVVKKRLGANHGYYLASLSALGNARQKAGDLSGAEAFYRQAISASQRIEPRYRIFVAQAKVYLGRLLVTKGSYDEAEKTLRESENLYREVAGTDVSIGKIKENLGTMYLYQSNYAKAEDELRKSLEILEKKLPPESPSTVQANFALGLTLTRAGHPFEGERYLRKALEIRNKMSDAAAGVGTSSVALTKSALGGALGECLTAQNRYAEAEPLLLDSYQIFESTTVQNDSRRAEAARRLYELYSMWGNPQKAALYKAINISATNK